MYNSHSTKYFHAHTHAAAQNLQLSYTNADIAEKLVRAATTTPAPVPTTKKSTFFGGIRNLFKSKDSAAADVAVTTPQPPTPTTPTTATVAGSKMIAALIVPSSTAKPAVVGASATSTTTVTPTTSTTTTTTTTAKPPTQDSPLGTTTTIRTPTVPTFGPRPRDPLHDFESYATITLTTKKPKVKEDFPALPAPRRPAAAATPTAAPAAAAAAAVPNAWGNGVSFVTTPRPTAGAGGSTTVGPTTTAATANPAGEASDAELEALTEVLYGKENSLLPLVTLNYQTRTQSSGTTDEAPLP